jgi:SNF2 family DNA or RNA helicase
VRRLKRDVLATLPRKTEATLYVPMSATQCELSRQLLLSGAKVLSRMQASTEEGAKHAEANRDWVQMQSLLISLRKCCNHPQLFGEWMGEVSQPTWLTSAYYLLPTAH